MGNPRVGIAIWAHGASGNAMHIEGCSWRGTFLDVGPSRVLHPNSLSKGLNDIILLDLNGLRICGHEEVRLLYLSEVQLRNDILNPMPLVNRLALESCATNVLGSVVEAEWVEAKLQGAILRASIVGRNRHLFPNRSIEAHDSTIHSDVPTSSPVVWEVKVKCGNLMRSLDFAVGRIMRTAKVAINLRPTLIDRDVIGLRRHPLLWQGWLAWICERSAS